MIIIVNSKTMATTIGAGKIRTICEMVSSSPAAFTVQVTLNSPKYGKEAINQYCYCG